MSTDRGNRRHHTDAGARSAAVGGPRLAVWLVTDSVDPSGLGSHMLALARELRHEVRITVVARRAPRSQVLLRAAEGLGVATTTLAGRTARDRASEIADLVHRSHPDIVHVHAGVPWEGAALTAAVAGTGCVVLRTEHQPPRVMTPKRRHRHETAVAAADAIICVSRANAASFAASGMPVSKIRVVPNGIVAGRPSHSRDETCALLGVPRDARLVLTIGRLVPQKGYRHLLDAAPDILATADDLHLLWVGSGPQQRRLTAAIERRGLGGRIHLVPSGHSVWNLLATATLLVVPSLWEGMPLVVLEAFAAGLPVVATAVDGTPEVVQDGVTGRLVPPADPGALADAVVGALRSPERAARCAAAARRRFELEHTARRMAQRTLEVYGESALVTRREAG